MTRHDDREIKGIVREQYAARARGAASCCGPQELDPETGAYPGIYLGTDLSRFAPEAVAASAGCGNPTALASLKPGEVVLDLGSGGGIDCFLASRAVGPAGRVLGIDMTPEMVELARDNAKSMDVANVRFLLGELEELPLESGSVDVVISNCVLCLSSDKSAVFSEAFRVLKAGGRLYVSDMILTEELPEEVRRDPQQWAACVAGADHWEAYLKRLAASGFQEVTLEQAGSSQPEGGQEHARSVQVTAVKPTWG